MAENRNRRGDRAPGAVSVADLRQLAARLAVALPPEVWALLGRAADGGGLHHPAQLGVAYESWLAADRRDRRGKGAYYTPPALVRFVVELALGPLLAGAQLAQIRALRVLDPALGGGVFALEVHRRIAHRLVALGLEGGAARRLAAACLHGFDRDPIAVEVARLALGWAGAEGAPLIAQDFLDTSAASGGPFDAVIGNPPWGAKGYLFPLPAAALRRAYRTARGSLDPCKLFVERAAGVTRADGRIAFLLPDVVLLKGDESFRRFVLGSLEIEGIAELGRAFPGVNVDVIAMSLVNRVAAPEHKVSLWDRPLALAAAAAVETAEAEPAAAAAADAVLDGAGPGSKSAPLVPAPAARTPQRLFGRLPGARFNLYWTAEALAVHDRLLTLGRLADAFEIHEGVHSGNVRAKLFGASAETPGAAPIVVGRRELFRYRLRWAGQYLDTRPEAIDRGAGEYANLGRVEWFNRPKLVVRRTGDRVIAAVDERGLHVSNNLFVLLPTAAAGGLEALWAACAMLNSGLMTWFYRAVEPRVGRLFAELKINQLARFPWAAPPAPQVLRLAALARRLAALDEQGGAAAEEVAAAEAALDAEVAALYGVKLPLPAMRARPPAAPGRTR